MKLFQVPGTNIQVLFRTRGEHRPPHVHVQNREVPWEAKIRFSFVDKELAVLEIDPEENEPSSAVVRKVLTAMADHTNVLRQKWWEMFGTVGLEGKWAGNLPRIAAQPQFEVLKGPRKGAARVRSVVFLPEMGKLRFTLANGETFEADVGAGRDLSDKD